jgi:hypothetical protein
LRPPKGTPAEIYAYSPLIPLWPVEVRFIFPFTDASTCERAAAKAKLVNIATQKFAARAWCIETLEQRA